MQSYPKKPKPLKKPSPAWTRRVDELYDREDGHCQSCGKWLNRNEANPHHRKTKGSGGTDDLENLDLLCYWCHVKIDSGEVVICSKCGGYKFRKNKCGC